MFMGSSEECCLHATLSSSAAGCGAVLLVAATILFVVGTTIERSQARTGEGQEGTTLEQSAGEHNEQAEATQGQANTTEGTEEHGNAGESGEELFGINPESAGLAAAVAAVSLLLAVLLVAVIGLVFAALDLREGIHQANESNTGLLIIALVTGLLHLGVTAAAAAGLRTPRAVATTT